MIFNKKSIPNVMYCGSHPEVVEDHIYLGVKMHKLGSFIETIKDLYSGVSRTYFKLMSGFKDRKLYPNVHIKLFDRLVKPIILYCSEVWGGFGIKTGKIKDIMGHLCLNEKTIMSVLILNYAKWPCSCQNGQVTYAP